MTTARLILAVAALCCSAHAGAQQAPEMLASMAGTWDVQQRMWPGPAAESIALPAAVAQRQVIRGMYLQEVMQSADGDASQAGAFTRNATLNFNPVTRQFEYTSLDSRAPQLMVERSAALPPHPGVQELKLQGGSFLAPAWGPSKNVKFVYRLTVGQVIEGKQTVRLYLTPQTVLPRREFLAFEYVYARRP
jgi:hypothetical protein